VPQSKAAVESSSDTVARWDNSGARVSITSLHPDESADSSTGSSFGARESGGGGSFNTFWAGLGIGLLLAIAVIFGAEFVGGGSLADAVRKKSPHVAQLEERDAKIAELEKEFEKLKESVKEDPKGEKRNAEERIALRGEIEKLMAKLEENKKNTEGLEQRSKKLQQKLDGQKHELERAQAEARRLKEQLESLNKKHAVRAPEPKEKPPPEDVVLKIPRPKPGPDGLQHKVNMPEAPKGDWHLHLVVDPAEFDTMLEPKTGELTLYHKGPKEKSKVMTLRPLQDKMNVHYAPSPREINKLLDSRREGWILEFKEDRTDRVLRRIHLRFEAADNGR
jgi:outer membrane murein-binding lipoprotein Lpp